MKPPVKEKIFYIIKIVIALILAVTMLASVAATVVRGEEVQCTSMSEKGDA